ncbi:Uncharacterised protein [uncultured archaeon]|nr:Uncharacterised protein [uncultured archaeon]
MSDEEQQRLVRILVGFAFLAALAFIILKKYAQGGQP